MEIVLNGKSKNINENLSVDNLLKDLNINPKAVVVELNLEILDKNNYKSAQLKENDKVEIVHFVGGGK